jgi:nitronate monooxygenase
MPIKTSLTALLDIEHPILSAPMDVIAGARLTMAVSAAGGFGILGGGYGDRAWLVQETTKLKQNTSTPFGVGFITWSLAKQPELLDIALDAKPRAIMLSFGDSRPFAARINAAGARLICQVQTEDMARQALEAGADVLVARGSETGGHGALAHHHRHRPCDRRCRGRARAGRGYGRHRRRTREADQILRGQRNSSAALQA